MSDWRDAVLAGIERLPPGVAVGGPPVAVWTGHGRIGRADVVVAVWDFAVHGGSFGVAEADAFVAACAEAVATRRPLLTLLRSGGTRLQEGMRALVGIPRSLLALGDLAAAGVPHITVADHPTTGGVWVAIGSTADVRLGVAGATVAFAGPRVIEATTGVAVPRGTYTAEAAAAAGLLDEVLAPELVATRLEELLVTLRPDDPQPGSPPAPVPVPDRDGWHQVTASRVTDRPAGAALLETLLDERVALRGRSDDVVAAIGRLHGHRAVAVALTARRAGRAGPDGYALLRRAATLASRLDLACVLLVDTAGADPLPASDQAGVAASIAAAAAAVLDCAAPTLSLVHGEGGSGGALAAAVTDVVAVADLGWFAALAPEGAAAALRISPPDAAGLLGLTPRDLLAAGFADALAPHEPAALAAWIGSRLDELRQVPARQRLAARAARWRAPLPGSSQLSPPDPPDIA